MEQFFEDYLDRLDDLHKQITDALDGLPVEALDWSPGEGVNSIAVLVTHLAGAERYWIGDVVMDDFKERVRADEFKVRGQTAEQLTARVEEVGAYAHTALAQMTVGQLNEARTSRTSPDTKITAGYALTHALGHAGTHLGHIQVMRDWWKAQR